MTQDVDLAGGKPNPYKTLDRVLSLRPAQQRKLLRLIVRCERGKCAPVRVFKVREGMLVQCRSDADVRDMQKSYPHVDDWSRRRAFFLQDWLELPPGVREISHLQVVCECDQTHPRSVDVRRVDDLLPTDSAPTRNVSLPQVAAQPR